MRSIQLGPLLRGFDTYDISGGSAHELPTVHFEGRQEVLDRVG